MTDPSKRYWITEQGIKEAAEAILNAPPEFYHVKELAEIIASHSEADGADWKRKALALVVLLRAKCSDEEWTAMQSKFEVAAHSEAARPPERREVNA